MSRSACRRIARQLAPRLRCALKRFLQIALKAQSVPVEGDRNHVIMAKHGLKPIGESAFTA